MNLKPSTGSLTGLRPPWSRPERRLGSEKADRRRGGAAGTAATISYYYDSGSNWTAAEQATFASAMALWAAVANVKFVQAATPAAANAVFYRYGTTTTPAGLTLDKGEAYLKVTYSPGQTGDTTLPATQSAYMSIDTSTVGWSHLSSFTWQGGEGVATVVHELGHLLGLDHAGPYNGHYNSATQQFNATDTQLWSVMSYIPPTDTNAKYFSSYPVTGTVWGYSSGDHAGTYTATTVMPLDILGAQRLYGTPATTALNNVTFGFNCTIQGACKPFFDFDTNTIPIVTLYATGLDNTFDVSRWSTPATINLNPGTFSSVNGMTNNIGIAFNTRIDSLVGGIGNDTITANADSDTIDGGAGSNTVVLGGTYADYTPGRAGDGSYTLSKGGITDTLRNVQSVRFADQTIATPFAEVTRLSSAQPLAAATTGRTVTLTVDMSVPVTVASGRPELLLNNGGRALYTGGSGSNALTFDYTPAAGQRTADLSVVGLALDGATVEDAAGYAADLTTVTRLAAPLRITGEAQGLDISGGGTSDILFRDPAGGGLDAFVMNNGQPTWTSLGWADPALQVVGIGDFNGDGTADVAFRDPTGGELGMFAMHAGQPSWTDFGWADPGLKVVGVGDFTGDGTDDVLFRDPASGALGMFAMSDNQPSWTDIGWADPHLQVVGVGDFNGDGTDDIAFRDPSSGTLSDFLMRNGQPTWHSLGWADPALQVAGIGDFNGDGTADIAFRDPVGGGVGMFAMNNNQATWASIGWAASTVRVSDA